MRRGGRAVRREVGVAWGARDEESVGCRCMRDVFWVRRVDRHLEETDVGWRRDGEGVDERMVPLMTDEGRHAILVVNRAPLPILSHALRAIWGPRIAMLRSQVHTLALVSNAIDFDTQQPSLPKTRA